MMGRKIPVWVPEQRVFVDLGQDLMQMHMADANCYLTLMS